MQYRNLDAWKAAHALVLAVLTETKDRLEHDPDLVTLLQWTALRAAGKIAFGSGTRNRRMFLHAMERSCGFLSEFRYHLSLARVTGLLAEATCTRLDALRGRAAFYGRQLLEDLLGVGSEKPQGGEPTDD